MAMPGIRILSIGLRRQVQLTQPMFFFIYPSAAAQQSFNFLVDVSDFKDSVYRVVDGRRVTQEEALSEDFARYLDIIQEYIEANSISEVTKSGVGM